MSNDNRIKIYIKVQYGTVTEVRCDRSSENLDIQICDLDTNDEEILEATNKKWDLETNQLYKVFKHYKSK
tara:strand:- start:930 stop:1139 length:210 start_codon:yes stop_codon:yes gene_type:complete